MLFGDRIAGDFGDGYENTLPREWSPRSPPTWGTGTG